MLLQTHAWNLPTSAFRSLLQRNFYADLRTLRHTALLFRDRELSKSVKINATNLNQNDTSYMLTMYRGYFLHCLIFTQVSPRFKFARTQRAIFAVPITRE